MTNNFRGFISVSYNKLIEITKKRNFLPFSKRYSKNEKTYSVNPKFGE